MYTVKELIETLKQCPEDYEVEFTNNRGIFYTIDVVGIDHNDKTVTLFPD